MTLRGIATLACALSWVVGCSRSSGDGNVDGTGTIGPGGGSVSLSNGPTVQVPAGALAVDTRITIATTTLAPPTGAVTPVYQFGPEGTSFGAPVQVSFPVPAGTQAADIAIYWTKQGSTTEWEVVPATLSGTTATGETSHFSAGFVGAACAAGEACAPANPCHAGLTTCNGTPACADTGASLPDATACGGGDLCAAGTCGPSYAGPITIARTYAVTPSGAAAFTQTDEVREYAPPSVTRTVMASDASGYTVRSFTFDAGAVLLGAIATYQADGTPAGVVTYTPPQLIIPSSTAAGATASSTSTVTGGATTFTLTRSMTVAGIESVTVPAGTFSALRITTSITTSIGPATVSVDWWAPGVGRVRSVGYPAATPSATTVTELVRTSPMVCSGGACACNALVDAAPEVQSTFVAANLPAPAGGTIVDGTYYLTAENVYTGPGGASGPTGQTIENVFVFQAGTLQFASRRTGADAGEERGTIAYQASGVELVLTPLCGLGAGAIDSTGFTASATVLRLIDAAPAGSLEQGKEAVLTRQ